ncbi:hypothetical protein IID24_04765 [Patescibacteria group bacterium]|nr:hypothetical protein [Patescibacteria group bacterium]
MSKLDIEALKNQETLTPEEEAQLQDEAPWGEEKKPEDDEWKPDEETDEEKSAREEKEAKESEDEKAEREAKEAEDTKAKEDAKAAEEAKKKAESEENETEEERVEREEAEAKEKEETEAKDKEVKKAEESKKAEEDEKAAVKVKAELISSVTKTLAEEKNISEDEAKAIVEAEYSYAEKYQHDPMKLARTARNIQVLYGKSEARLKEMDAKTVPNHVIQLEDRSLIVPGRDGRNTLWTFDTIIEKFRKQAGEEAEDKSDDEIYDMAMLAIKATDNKSLKERDEKLSVDARIKRTEIASKIPEADKKFLPDIEKFIEGVGDAQIADANFDISDVIKWVKGSRYDEDFKVMEAEITKKVEEQTKILGERKPVIPKGKKTVKSSGTLSDADKVRAEAMYSTSGMSKEEMYREFASSGIKDDKW